MLALLPAAAALLLGSTLTFWLQPMIGRLLRPEYGGSASVWAVCLAAFQVLLLAGYGYAYLVSRLSARLQRILHLLVLAAAAVWAWRGVAPLGASPGAAVAPLVLRDVLRLAGAPFVAIAAGSTLLQNWLAQDDRDRRVYRLYALSNVGSCLGLLLYPLILEPFAAVQAQRIAWAASMAVYVLAVAAVAARKRKTAPDTTLNAQCGTLNADRSTFNAQVEREPTSALSVLLPLRALRALRGESPPSAFSVQRSALNVLPGHSPRTTHHSRLHFWLPCLSSALLVAITTQVTQQIIALPLIWALILGAFLLSYVVGFSDRTEDSLPVWRHGVLVLLTLSPLAFAKHADFRLGLAVIAYGLALMFVAGTWLHGTLYASRPPARGLPRFYFMLAAGGALGGALTSLLAPVCFKAVWEFPLTLLALAALVFARRNPRHAQPADLGDSPTAHSPGAACLSLQERSTNPENHASLSKTAPHCVKAHETLPLNLSYLQLLALIGISLSLWKGFVPSTGTRWQDRDFYGAVAVLESHVATQDGQRFPMRQLAHGSVNHGQQYLKPGWQSRPLSYFGPHSGAALAIDNHPKRLAIEPVRIGIVGLGIGTLVAYARTGDACVCYEISRPVLNVATNPAWFTYLADTPADLTLKLGDGRKLLEAERAAGEPAFDVLFLDAFSGDSPPLHLVTREAFQLYLDRLEPDGVIAMNITNWHMNFLPLCKGLAAAFGLDVQGFYTPEDPRRLQAACVWALLSRSPRAYSPHPAVRRIDWSRVRDVPVPTDSRGSALRFVGSAKGVSRAFE